MTPEQAKEFLPLITAFANGETIQYRAPIGGWSDIKEATWSVSVNQYRIKPKTKTVGYGAVLMSDSISGKSFLAVTSEKIIYDRMLANMACIKIIKNWEEFEVEE